MPRRSLWRRVADTGFNLEQFRSELADEAQLAAALPDEVRVKSLREKAFREQRWSKQPGHGGAQAQEPQPKKPPNPS